jgi:putative DNA primase/helicase
MNATMTADRSRISSALSCIPSGDRDLWVKMGMAVKSELSDEEGFSVWSEWSQGDDSYKERDAVSVWRGIDSGGNVSIGSLFFEAKEHGWQDTGTIHTSTPAEIAQRAADRASKDAAARIKKASEHASGAKNAGKLWATATPAPAEHPYLVRKQVAPVTTIKIINLTDAVAILGYAPKQNDAPLIGPLLVIPVKIGEAISTCELIDGDGRKHAIKDGAKACGYWAAQRLPDGDGTGLTLAICEGVATTLSVVQASAHHGIAALSAGNLVKVAQAMRHHFPAAVIILAADLDKTTGAPDRHAIEAAATVGGLLAVPDFGLNREPGQTDFNDMAVLYGLEAVKAIIDNAASVQLASTPSNSAQSNEAQSDDAQGGWSAPEPLIRNTIAAPYPVDALPEVIRLAVEEVQGFTQAPPAMVACSALASLSLAAQAHHDVQRAENLSGPIGLYFLVIAESGERKSTCDGIFSKVLREYESQQQEDAKPEISQFKADFSTWESIRAGILDAIKQEAKKPSTGGNAGQLEHDLRNHQEREPEPPRVPRLIYSDFTPEALTYSLAKTWPSGGVISSEAGAVFGSHAMSGDSQMRTLSNLNQLWEAARLTFDRRGAGGSYVVDGARLTMALQVQKSALMEFFKRTGSLARGTGFLARFLMAHPESTQGTRLYKEPPENMPALAAYHSQLHRILQTPAPINEEGGLEPSMIGLTPDAKAAWIKFHDEIEQGLGKGGELQDVRDVASKIADNAVRMAALFHVIDGGIGAISLEHFESASIIAAWHLNEALRFFGELALPEAELDAAALDEWLIEYCKVNRMDVVSTRAISQYGPYKVRGKDRLSAAVMELTERGRVAVIQSGKKREIQINPQLLGG